VSCGVIVGCCDRWVTDVAARMVGFASSSAIPPSISRLKGQSTRQSARLCYMHANQVCLSCSVLRRGNGSALRDEDFARCLLLLSTAPRKGRAHPQPSQVKGVRVAIATQCKTAIAGSCNVLDGSSQHRPRTRTSKLIRLHSDVESSSTLGGPAEISRVGSPSSLMHLGSQSPRTSR
jgi:hypothetical protein